MAKTIQEQFDDLVTEHGAPAIIEAIKAHALPDIGGCGKSGCPKGYYCSSDNVCVLDA